MISPTNSPANTTLKKPIKEKLKKIEKTKTLKNKTKNEYNMNQTTEAEGNIKDFIKILEQLEIFMKNKGEIFRAIAYKKATAELNKLELKSLTPSQLKALNIKAIGKTILEKFAEFIKTGTLEAIEKEKENPINIFVNIYGIGPKKAEELVNIKKITTLEELEERQHEIQENKLPLLNTTQQTGLKYYKPLLKRIPRAEIEKFKTIISQLFEETILENNEKIEDHKFEIAGSYRRQFPDSGDIDFIFTSENGNKIIFNKFIDKLLAKNILLH